MDEIISEKRRSVFLHNEIKIPANYKDPETVQEALDCPMLGNYWRSAKTKEIQKVHNTKTLDLIYKDEVLGSNVEDRWTQNGNLNTQFGFETALKDDQLSGSLCKIQAQWEKCIHQYSFRNK